MLTLGPTPEASNAQYTAYLKDETGVAVALTDISALTLTLRDKTTRAIINSRTAQNVLNTNNVTVHATSGLVTWSIQAADVTAVNANQPYVEHIAEFNVTWDTTKKSKHQVAIQIQVAW